MGEKLANKIDAVFKAHLEQQPLFQRANAEGPDLTLAEVTQLNLDPIAALRVALHALALELPDL